MNFAAERGTYLTLEEYFRQFTLFFGGSAEQERTFAYLQYLASFGSTERGAAQHLRPFAAARARRELMDSLTWQASTIRTPFQTWLCDRVGSRDGLLVVSQRFFPRRETQGAGIAPHSIDADGAVTSGQLGVFLSYVSEEPSVTIDARLVETGLSRTALAVEMIDAASRLPFSQVLAGSAFGNDEQFREAMRARDLAYIVQVFSSCPIFWSPSAKLDGWTARKRSSSFPRDIMRGTVAAALGDTVGIDAREFRARPVWDASGSAASGLGWASVRLNGTDQSPEYVLNYSEIPASEQLVTSATETLARPTAQLAAPTGTSLFDISDSLKADGWHRHMMLAMLVSAWNTQETVQLDPNSQPPRNGAIATPMAHPRPTTPAKEALGHRTSRPALGRRGQKLGGITLAATLAMAVLIIATGALITTARSLPALGQRELINVSSFYHPPEDGTSINAFVGRTSQVIYTRGDERYLQQMRDLGFKGQALQYLVSNEVSGPERAASASVACGDYLQTGNDVTGISRDFCAALHRDERNFIHNGKGERLFTELSYQEGNTRRTRYYYLMNPGSQAWRDFFAEKAAENVSALPYDGLFLDNIDLTPRRAAGMEKNSDGKVAEYPGDRAYRDAVVGYLQTLRTRLPNTAIWANLTEGDTLPDDYLPYLPYLDGVMNEYFITQEGNRVVGPNGWSAQLAQADSVISQGKSFLAVAQGNRADTNRMRFALASYLMIAGPNTYFRYANGERYQESWQYDDLENHVGSPLGPRYQDGDQWRRDFSCGTVSVDIERRAGDISIGSNQPTCLAERAVLKLPLLRGLLSDDRSRR